MPWDLALIFVFLAVIIPWRGTVRLRKLLAMPALGPRERIALYFSTIAFQWALAALVAWRAWARGFTYEELGIHNHSAVAFAVATVAGTLFFAVFHWTNLRRAGRVQGSATSTVRQVAQKILPRTSAEEVPYFALAATAGICEEFLYRGFAMAVLARLGLTPWLIVVTTALLFGLAHLYQGRAGLIGTSLVGLVFGAARIWLESMLPMIFWHATIDAIAGIAGKRFLVNNESVCK